MTQLYPRLYAYLSLVRTYTLFIPLASSCSLRIMVALDQLHIDDTRRRNALRIIESCLYSQGYGSDVLTIAHHFILFHHLYNCPTLILMYTLHASDQTPKVSHVTSYMLHTMCWISVHQCNRVHDRFLGVGVSVRPHSSLPTCN